MTFTFTEKGPIFVSGADSDKGYAIVQKLLDTPNQLGLESQKIFGSVMDDTTLPAKTMKSAGVSTLVLDIFQNPSSVVNALKKVSKLVLVIDPLNKRITKHNAFEYGKKLIDAANEANVQHVIFLTPFSNLDPLSPPSSPSKTNEKTSAVSYRSQFMLIQSYLESVFPKDKITLLCYPGILHQHLLVFKNYIQQHNAFPLPDQYLESSVESSNLDDIAQAAAYISYSPTCRHGGKSYKLTGPQLLTLEEVSSSVLKGLGHDMRVNNMDIGNLQHLFTQSIGNQDHADFLLEIWGLQNNIPLGIRKSEVTRDMEALIGQSGKTLKEYFQDVEVCNKFLSNKGNGIRL